MRITPFLGFISASLLMLVLTAAPGLARAQGPQSLDAEEQAFLHRAMSDNATQIAMAKLALQKSSNPQVIELANAVLAERQSLDTRLAALLGEHPTDVALSNPDAVAQLATLDGAAFDRSFAGLSVRDHNLTLSTYQCARASSRNQAIRELLHQATPELQSNLMVAMAVARSGNMPTMPSAHSQQALTAVASRNSKSPVFSASPMSSLVAVPW